MVYNHCVFAILKQFMTLFNKNFEQSLYHTTGTNISFYNYHLQLNYLAKHLSKSYYNHHVVDIGCGDGHISVHLQKLLKPKSFKGIDLSANLVKKCQNRGIDASVFDIEKQDFNGDLGVLWGVVHHFSTPVSTLQNINSKFKSLIIREPINRIRLFESGHRYSLTQIDRIISQSKIHINKRLITPDLKAVIYFIDKSH